MADKRLNVNKRYYIVTRLLKSLGWIELDPDQNSRHESFWMKYDYTQQILVPINLSHDKYTVYMRHAIYDLYSYTFSNERKELLFSQYPTGLYEKEVHDLMIKELKHYAKQQAFSSAAT